MQKTPTPLIPPEPPIVDDAARQLVSALPSAFKPSASAPSNPKDKRSPSRKRSTLEAEKGKAVVKENAEKKQKSAVPGSSPYAINPASMSFRHDIAELVCIDATPSAVIFSKVKSSSDHLPPPDTLAESGLYTDMSLCGTKVCSDKTL